MPLAMTVPLHTMSTGDPAANGPDAEIIPTGSSDLCFDMASDAPLSTAMRPDGLTDFSHLRFCVRAESALNHVPIRSPWT